MAEATLTKSALTRSFKGLILEQPFSKISVGDICKSCDLNRKSFYYHYKDKYDLANSIFDNEFPFLSYDASYNDIDVLKALCRYLGTNRAYYKKLLSTEGQNSFYDHLRIRLKTYFQKRLSDKSSFCTTFWSDAVALSIKEWIISKNPASTDDFYSQLSSCIRIENRAS